MPISWLVWPTVSWIDYYSSVSGPPRLGVVRLTVSYSVTRTTPGTGSSTTSMIVSSMTGTLCLPTFLGAFFAEVFRGRFFVVARFAIFLREDLALALPRFEAFLRVATRFFALAMAVSCKDYRRAIDKDYPSVIRRATFISGRRVISRPPKTRSDSEMPPVTTRCRLNFFGEWHLTLAVAMLVRWRPFGTEQAQRARIRLAIVELV